MNINYYLNPGEQTQIDSDIKEVVGNFKRSGIHRIIEILEWVHKNIKLNNDLEFKQEIFRKRTAAQILDGGQASGCTDYALVFIVLARASGVPTKYTEAIKDEWIISGSDLNNLDGHVFAEIYLDEDWVIVDPQAATIKAWYGKRFHKIKEGLDSWGIGIYGIEDLRQLFLEFSKDKLQ